MRSAAASVEEYIGQLPPDQAKAFSVLRQVVRKNLPKGFEETMGYGMVGYVVPHKIFPQGYHCDPRQPLPFINLAVQKNFIALYHMGIYADPQLCSWFTSEYPKHTAAKLDMGKSCIRFKKPDQIPLELIGELCQKVSVQGWIAAYTKMPGSGKSRKSGKSTPA